MIAADQIQRVWDEVIRTILRRGDIPTHGEVDAELQRHVPRPGRPTTQTFEARDGQLIDIDTYNEFWLGIERDITTLYAAMRRHALLISTRLSAIASKTVAIHNRVSILDELSTVVDQHPGVVDVVSDNFGTAYTLDLSGTTAAIDHIEGKATCPELPDSYHKISLIDVGATISGKPVSGTELPVPGASLYNTAKPLPTSWVTQVLSGGGGCSYVVKITLSEPVSATKLVVETTHTQGVSVRIKEPGGELESITTPYEPLSEVEEIEITLTRASGDESGGQFIYTFGLKSVCLALHQYKNTAVVKTRPISVPTNAGRVLLLANEETPAGTSITYSMLRDAASVSLVNGSALSLGASTIVESLPASYDTLFCGQDVLGYTLSGDQTARLLAPHAGVFRGNGQWRVQTYEFDWSMYSGHAPGPDDWANLPQGVRDYEVAERYRSFGASSLLWSSSDCIQPGETQKLSTNVYCLSAMRLEDSDEPFRLIDIAAAASPAIVAALYINGAQVTIRRDDPVITLARGWNTIEVYAYRLQDDGVDIDIAFGWDLSADDDPTSQAVLRIARAERNQLDMCSRFDLEYNTPPTFHGRCAVFLAPTASPETRILVPDVDGALYHVVYDDGDADTTTVTLIATLHCDDTNTVRPALLGYTLEFT